MGEKARLTHFFAKTNFTHRAFFALFVKCLVSCEEMGQSAFSEKIKRVGFIPE